MIFNSRWLLAPFYLGLVVGCMRGHAGRPARLCQVAMECRRRAPIRLAAPNQEWGQSPIRLAAPDQEWGQLTTSEQRRLLRESRLPQYQIRIREGAEGRARGAKSAAKCSGRCGSSAPASGMRERTSTHGMRNGMREAGHRSSESQSDSGAQARAWVWV